MRLTRKQQLRTAIAQLDRARTEIAKLQADLASCEMGSVQMAEKNQHLQTEVDTLHKELEAALAPNRP